MSAKLVLFHTMTWNCSPKLLGQAGVIQQLHCKERTIAAGQSWGEINPEQLSWGIWFLSIKELLEMAVEGSPSFRNRQE